MQPKRNERAKPSSCAERPLTARLPARAEGFFTTGFTSPGGFPTAEQVEGCYRTLPLATDD